MGTLGPGETTHPSLPAAKGCYQGCRVGAFTVSQYLGNQPVDGWRDATGARCGDVVIYEYPIYIHFLLSIHHYGKYLNIIEYSVYFASGVCISCNWCRISSSQFCNSLNGTPDLSQPAKWQGLKSIQTVQLLPCFAAEIGSGCIVDIRNYIYVCLNSAQKMVQQTEHANTHSLLLVCSGLATKVAPGSLSDRDERKVAQ